MSRLGALEAGAWGVTPDGQGASSQDDANSLKWLAVMVAQLCEYTKIND